MIHIFGIAVTIGLFGFVLWLVSSNGKSGDGASRASDQTFDSADPRAIGILIGMTGGSITDAVVARYVLQRFEEIHGRKATTRDLGTIIGLTRTL